MKRMKSVIMLEFFAICICCGVWMQYKSAESMMTQEKESDYIKWVDFNVSYEALFVAYELDLETYGQDVHLNWIELLAYGAAKSGGDFNSKVTQEISQVAEQVVNKETTWKEITKDMEYYDYYLEAYGAVLNGYVGEYEIETEDGSGKFETCYGLKAFSPIAKGFPYSDYDDFGVSRSYGYKREHLGHDMMGQIGTPI